MRRAEDIISLLVTLTCSPEESAPHPISRIPSLPKFLFLLFPLNYKFVIFAIFYVSKYYLKRLILFRLISIMYIVLLVLFCDSGVEIRVLSYELVGGTSPGTSINECPSLTSSLLVGLYVYVSRRALSCFPSLFYLLFSLLFFSFVFLFCFSLLFFSIVFLYCFSLLFFSFVFLFLFSFLFFFVFLFSSLVLSLLFFSFVFLFCFSLVFIHCFSLLFFFSVFLFCSFFLFFFNINCTSGN